MGGWPVVASVFIIDRKPDEGHFADDLADVALQGPVSLTDLGWRIVSMGVPGWKVKDITFDEGGSDEQSKDRSSVVAAL